ncbi:MAG: M3 family metallopeptidase, partial [Bacteroidota bacterium]
VRKHRHPRPRPICNYNSPMNIPLEKSVMEAFSLFPAVEGTLMSTAFSHIFQGGYSSGYYSYKWAEVLDADAFELFKEKGIFDPEVAQAFQKFILSRGGSEHPQKLYKQFRGADPDPKALLRRTGLLK